MTLTIELSPETELRLREQALIQGIETPQLARRILEQALQLASLPDARATALASETTLAKIWNTPEEDEAWQDL